MNARYYIEHDFIPQMLTENANGFISTLISGRGECMKMLYDTICNNLEESNPYTADDFKIEPFKISDNQFFICITMPEKDIEPLLCMRVYIVFDNLFDNVKYFTIEKTENSDYFMCSWQDGKHMNYGDAPNGINEETDAVLQIAFPEEK